MKDEAAEEGVAAGTERVDPRRRPTIALTNDTETPHARTDTSLACLRIQQRYPPPKPSPK